MIIILDDRFGISVFAKGDSLLVGALSDTVKNTRSGAVYFFVNEGGKWKKKNKIFPSDEQDGDWFGIISIITDEKIIVGAPLSSDNGIHMGKVYLYTSYPLGINEEEIIGVEEFYLSQNYPNPFNPKQRLITQFQYDGFVNLRVYDILGNEVDTLVNERKTAGFHSVEFSAKGGSASGGNAYDLPSGIYFYKLTAGTFTETKKLILLK